jgi:polyphosphate kinase 2 (PPK2 family)
MATQRTKPSKPARKPKAGATRQQPEAYEFAVYPPGTLKLRDLDLSVKVKDKAAYEAELHKLQREIMQAQVEAFRKNRRAALVFEGWDAAGKGGAIRRLTARLDPRGYKVWPIAAPRDAEGRHHYLWRFWTRLPEEGELAIFDRSWYGRVLVERVEGLCSTAAWERAYDEINAFERMLTDDGVRMAKFFIHIDKKTQLKRFRDREQDPVKQYKIGPEDWRNREKWKAYENAVSDMLDRTHRPDAPWHLVAGNDKKHARLQILRTVRDLLTS